MKLIFLKRISVCLAATAFAVAAQAAQVVPVIEVNQNNSASGNYALSQSSQLIITIQQLQDEVRSLRGQLESQEYRLKRIETDQKERYRDLDRRLSLIMQSQMQGESGAVSSEEPRSTSSVDVKAQEKTSAEENTAGRNTSSLSNVDKSATASSETAGSSAGDQSDYQAAFALVRERDFNAAANSFTSFLTDYPDSPRVANAYYWLGEIYLAQGKQKESEASFLRVADQYRDSRKASDALYKLGILYKQQGNLEKSMIFMSRVVKEYPDTSAAQLAASALGQ
ncbi:tol-pal system protein YbgF [Neptunomonas qingdaonensis]|uniref:Cell division coordinator CpoB n=1 Tax=Neptunomonas qingdaonensis TaxID=1045558 RepID=A0A1I2UX80_9GAMM|nr:tol-pal system protein YbgF [Neptunomonas qingdaonensis]SFG80809.1 tol-pal system protein YbgF [Neptunomonas qingdaonensis]